MPTYEYSCRACGEHVEVVQAFTDPPLTACPNCGGELRKVFGSVGIVLKGSGFYKNDSRSASDKKVAASKGASESTAGGGTDGASSGSPTSDAGSSSTSAPSTGSGSESKAAASTGASTSS
jgi:putative FmdB family regulatory protein